MALGRHDGQTRVNLLLFNLVTDADDSIFAFTTPWINRLAQHYDAVDVVTMRAGRIEVADNVRVFSVGKEHGFSEPRRAAVFFEIVSRLMRDRRYAACFAHQQPLFALMAAPLLQPARIPITVWYNHRSRHWTARYALRIARRITTSTSDSFPFPSAKVRVVGQGVDTDYFSPSGDGSGTDLVYVARLSPIKAHDVLLKAVASVQGLRVVLVGGAPKEDPPDYVNHLHALVNELGIGERVTFAGPQKPDGVRAAYASAALSINLSPSGLFDKTAFEAMACAVPTLVTNPGFLPVLGDKAPLLLLPSGDDPALIASRLQAVLTIPAAERRALGERLRRAVVAQNSLDVLIPRLVSVINTGELPP